MSRKINIFTDIMTINSDDNPHAKDGRMKALVGAFTRERLEEPKMAAEVCRAMFPKAYLYVQFKDTNIEAPDPEDFLTILEAEFEDEKVMSSGIKDWKELDAIERVAW